MRLNKFLYLTIFFTNFLCSQEQKLIIGTSLPLQKEGKVIEMGTQACINTINKQGGVKGKKLKLLAQDDKKSISQSIANIKQMLSTTKIFVNLFTSDVATELPQDIIKQGILIFGPEENSTLIQQEKYSYIINTKPSIYQELKVLIDYAVNIKKRKKIAIFYVDDEIGQSGRDNAVKILAKYGLKPIGEATHPRRTVDTHQAAQKLAELQPDIIICLGRRHATYNFIIQALNAELTRTIFLGTSYLLPIQKQLKIQRGIDLITTSVTPNPETSKLPIAEEYRKSLKESYSLEPFSTVSFSAYINTALLADLAQKISGQINPQNIINQAEQLDKYNFKGLMLNFDPQTRSINQNIWLTTGYKQPWKKVANKGE